jgi:hypothetical protein
MVIGTAKITDFESFYEWAITAGKCWPYNEKIAERITNEINNDFSNLYESKEYDSFMQRDTDNTYKLEKFKEIYDYSVEYEIPFDLIETNQIFTILQFAKERYYIPTRFIKSHTWKDYSHIPLSEIRGIADSSNPSEKGRMYLSAINETTTIASVQGAIKQKKSEIEHVKSSLKNMKEEMAAEVERLKAEIEAKYKSMIAVKEEAALKMAEMIKQMENELFMMSTEIYGIRCFLGETIQFIQLRDGKPSPINEPVILYQRLRFLDEEMGKLISLYDIKESDIPMFEKYIKSCDHAADHFAPGPKSISLVKLTRNSKGYISSEKYANTLKKYEVYHGNRIAIIIRNGDNVYIGWTDCDMIDISDENIFYRPNKSENEINDERSTSKLKKTSKQEVASRYFVFSILEGVLSSGKIMQIPERESFFHGGGKYVIFSMADGYIEDTRFGLFSVIMKRCNKNIQKGDKILCIQYLRAEHHQGYSAFINDRGRGDMNRTHDVRADNNTIYTVNLVEKEEYPIVEYKRKKPFGKDGEDEYETMTTKGTLETINFSDDVEVIGQKTRAIYQCFISLHKTYSENARANFEIYDDEYINLTFLNSVWLLYAIQNQKIGKWYIGGQEVSYAYSVRYLNKALEYIREREKKEESLISKYTELPNEWQVALSEWKIKNNVHVITDYQAKRFAKHMAEAGK